MEQNADEKKNKSNLSIRLINLFFPPFISIPKNYFNFLKLLIFTENLTTFCFFLSPPLEFLFHFLHFQHSLTLFTVSSSTPSSSSFFFFRPIGDISFLQLFIIHFTLLTPKIFVFEALQFLCPFSTLVSAIEVSHERIERLPPTSSSSNSSSSSISEQQTAFSIVRRLQARGGPTIEKSPSQQQMRRVLPRRFGRAPNFWWVPSMKCLSIRMKPLCENAVWLVYLVRLVCLR